MKPSTNKNAASGEWYSSVPHSTRGHTMFGFVFLGVMVTAFGVWANSAPIAGAVVASGVFITSGQNKIVQHLEGGVIKDLLVHEGDVVKSGQILVRLDRTAPEAELRRLILKRDRLAAIEARLRAEVNEQDAVQFPARIKEKENDDDYRAMIGNQLLAFKARRDNLHSDIMVLEESIKSLEEKNKGTERQRASTLKQIDLLQQELAGKAQLLVLGQIRKSEVLAIERAVANAQGEVARLDGDLGDGRERIIRTQAQIVGTRNTAIKAAAEQLNDMHAEQDDVRERILSASDILARVDIRAPVSGVVVKLRYHTPGGVVEPGRSILEIVPVNEELLIEARVRPQDIANLKLGQTAFVRLTALNMRITPMVNGQLIYISADTLPDEKRMTGGPVDQYVARVKLNPESAQEIRNFLPVPGMPAEVYIKTSEHTFFEYIVKPLRDSMQRAFRET
jgi:HlyD family type I secretion membrane fusion protein